MFFSEAPMTSTQSSTETAVINVTPPISGSTSTVTTAHLIATTFPILTITSKVSGPTTISQLITPQTVMIAADIPGTTVTVPCATLTFLGSTTTFTIVFWEWSTATEYLPNSPTLGIVVACSSDSTSVAFTSPVVSSALTAACQTVNNLFPW